MNTPLHTFLNYNPCSRHKNIRVLYTIILYKIVWRPPHNNKTNEINDHTLEPDIGEPTQNEIDAAVDGLKNTKASGDDGVVAELLKRGGLSLRNKLTKIIRCVWRVERIPDDWTTAIIYPIYKTENPTVTENYRGSLYLT